MSKKGLFSINKDPVVRQYLSTGSTILDLAISCNKSEYGGVPTSRILEFSGTGASGKTYIAGELCGSALRKGFDFVGVDDIERRWDLERLGTFGFKPSHKKFFYFEEPSSTIEMCFDRLFSILKRRRDKHVLYIIDPIAALYSEVILTKSDKMGQARAKALQKYFRFLKDYMSSREGSVSIVFSNQLIDNVGVMFGEKQTTPCGNALKHWPSVRVKFKKSEKIFKSKGSTVVSGVQLTAEVIKNSEDHPFRTAKFSIIYGYGIDDIMDCTLWLAENTSVLGNDTSDGIFKWKRKEITGLRRFVAYVEHNDLEEIIRKLTRQQYKQFYQTAKRKPKTRPEYS